MWCGFRWWSRRAYFLLSALPAFFIITEKTPAQEREAGKGLFKVAVERLSETIRSVRSFREFIKFMVALLIYNDGIIAALDFAAIIGAVLFGVTDTELIIFVIIVQVTNILGSYAYALIGERLGFKTSLVQSLVLMCDRHWGDDVYQQYDRFLYCGRIGRVRHGRGTVGQPHDGERVCPQEQERRVLRLFLHWPGGLPR